MTKFSKWLGVGAALLCTVSPALAASLSRADAQAVIENKFTTIDPTYVLLWKSIDVGAPEVPSMYDKVQLEVPADVEVFMVRAAFTAKSGDGPRYDGRDYVSYYVVYNDHQGQWRAEQSAEDGTYESDPYYMN